MAPATSVLYVTPANVVNASDMFEQLNACLDGPWNSSFLNFTLQTAHHVVNMNSTRVPAVSGSSQWNAIVQLGGWVQQLSAMLSLR